MSILLSLCSLHSTVLNYSLDISLSVNEQSTKTSNKKSVDFVDYVSVHPYILSLCAACNPCSLSSLYLWDWEVLSPLPLYFSTTLLPKQYAHTCFAIYWIHCNCFYWIWLFLYKNIIFIFFLAPQTRKSDLLCSFYAKTWYCLSNWHQPTKTSILSQ